MHRTPPSRYTPPQPSSATAEAKRYSSRLLLKSQLRSGRSGLHVRPSAVAILKVSSAMKICDMPCDRPQFWSNIDQTIE